MIPASYRLLNVMSQPSTPKDQDSEKKPLTPKEKRGASYKFSYQSSINSERLAKDTDLTTSQRRCLRLPKTPLPISVPLALHYSFVTLALCCTTRVPWLPAYFFGHIVVILAGVWAARDLHKVQPVLLYIYILAFSCIIDAIQLGCYFNIYDDETRNGETFGYGYLDRALWLLSVVAVFTHLVLKPFVIIYASFVIAQRLPSGACACRSRENDGENGEIIDISDQDTQVD